MPCSLVENYQRFGGTSYFVIHGSDSYSLKMEAEGTHETLIKIYQTTRRYSLEYSKYASHFSPLQSQIIILYLIFFFRQIFHLLPSLFFLHYLLYSLRFILLSFLFFPFFFNILLYFSTYIILLLFFLDVVACRTIATPRSQTDN
jgi:ABC-type antimicrobial peptide transport system permease subunit